MVMEGQVRWFIREDRKLAEDRPEVIEPKAEWSPGALRVDVTDSELAQLALTLIIGQEILLLAKQLVGEFADLDLWTNTSSGMGNANMRPEAAWSWMARTGGHCRPGRYSKDCLAWFG